MLYRKRPKLFFLLTSIFQKNLYHINWGTALINSLWWNSIWRHLQFLNCVGTLAEELIGKTFWGTNFLVADMLAPLLFSHAKKVSNWILKCDLKIDLYVVNVNVRFYSPKYVGSWVKNCHNLYQIWAIKNVWLIFWWYFKVLQHLWHVHIEKSSKIAQIWF